MSSVFEIYQFPGKMKKDQDDSWQYYGYNVTSHIQQQPNMFWIIVKAFISGCFKKDDPDPETKNYMYKYENKIFWL
jgi:hypothetical protein